MKSWCSYCGNKKLCIDENCVYCFNKSFKSFEKSKYWSFKNTVSSRHVFKWSNTSYYFDCECGHTFVSIVGNITKGQWCPFCAVPAKKICNNEECIQCTTRSFSSHPMSKYWSTKNKLKSRDVLRFSHVKYIFNCNLCTREFSQELNSINQGQWCPYCKNKTESKMLDWLKNLKSYIIVDYEFQPKFDWCKNENGNKLPFDFLIKTDNFKVLIEIDGDQHFIDIPRWDSLARDVVCNDKYKSDLAIKHDYNFIRIYQPDVWRDTIDWKNIISSIVSNLSNMPEIFFVSTKSVYDDHL